MKKIFTLALIMMLLLTGCAEIKEQTEESQEAVVPYEELEVIADNLDIPWSIVKTDDTFYLTERPGGIVKVQEGKVERQKVELKKTLAAAAEAGLLGFVLAPDFSESNKAFAYYTYQDSSGQFNRIVTLKLGDNAWKEEDLLLDKIPSGDFHHGGRLKIGPDGKLYATTGDATHAEIAQDVDSIGGKILRMNLDGSIPSDNPFRNSYIYSYGHRNPQGLTWSSNGTLYTSEHGNSANDEINKIQPGKNYGWPVIEGNEKKAGMESPLFTSGENTTWAPSGMAYFNDKLYVAALRGTAVIEFNLKTREKRNVITGLGRVRDVFIDEGSLYFISNNTDGRGNPLRNDDHLYRISLSNLQ